jgi:hypothetical protein
MDPKIDPKLLEQVGRGILSMHAAPAALPIFPTTTPPPASPTAPTPPPRPRVPGELPEHIAKVMAEVEADERKETEAEYADALRKQNRRVEKVGRQLDALIKDAREAERKKYKKKGKKRK